MSNYWPVFQTNMKTRNYLLCKTMAEPWPVWLASHFLKIDEILLVKIFLILHHLYSVKLFNQTHQQTWCSSSWLMFSCQQHEEKWAEHTTPVDSWRWSRCSCRPLRESRTVEQRGVVEAELAQQNDLELLLWLECNQTVALVATFFQDASEASLDDAVFSFKPEE